MKVKEKESEKRRQGKVGGGMWNLKNAFGVKTKKPFPIPSSSSFLASAAKFYSSHAS